MNKLYNTQEDIASSLNKILHVIYPGFRKTQLNILPYIILGMIISESAVTSDIAKVLKGKFSLIQFDSITKRIRRFFNNDLFKPYVFFKEVVLYVLSNYKLKHDDNTIHIIFDHMYSKDNYTILLVSMRIGKQGIPIYFRCFDGIREPEAFTDKTIINAIMEVCSYFKDFNYDLVFLADRWFNSKAILSTIDKLGHTYCIRLKSDLKIKVYDEKEKHYIYKYTGDLNGLKYKGKYYEDVYLYKSSTYKTNITISKYNDIDEPWIIATNGDPAKAVKRYSYRFGGIECIFKNQKSNGFNIESICNSSIKSFTTMYTCVCFCVLFLTILGADYSKNSNCYKNTKIETHKSYNGVKKRIMSLFKTGLTLFKLAFNSLKYIRLPFKFILYDI